jgi:hypothetical protein
VEQKDYAYLNETNPEMTPNLPAVEDEEFSGAGCLLPFTNIYPQVI